MRGVMSEGGPGSWLNIFDFAADPAYEKYKELKFIYDLSFLQSPTLDNILLQDMYNEHLQVSSLPH